MICEPIVETEAQILGERVRIVGTPFTLNYRSDRVPGRLAAYALSIPLSGKSVPANLTSIELEIEIAGQQLAKRFPPKPQQDFDFTWDGKDASGHPVRGKRVATIRIAYVYPGSYPRPQVIRRQEWPKAVGVWDAREAGLGAWTLSAHHRYDPIGQILYFGDGSRRTKPGVYPLPGVDGPGGNGKTGRNDSPGSSAPTEILLPSEEGSEFYVFNDQGRHLRTVSLLGGVRYRFEYDDAGRLNSVQDGYGNLTRVERTAEGLASSIVGPQGHRTVLALNPVGFLSAIANPADELIKLNYSNNGLLLSLTDAAGNAYRYTYDADGRLVRTEDPTGGGDRLARSRTETTIVVARITAMAREFSYSTERLPDGDEQRVSKCCGGRQIRGLTRANGTVTISFPEGTTIERRDGHGLPALSLAESVSVKTPGGLVSTLARERTVGPTPQDNPLSQKRLTETASINGRTYTLHTDIGRRQITETSPSGRKTIRTVDSNGQTTRVEALGLFPMDFSYDERGRLTSVQWGSGREQRVVSLGRNVAGSIEAITDSLGRVWRFEYSQAGQISKQILPDGRPVAFSYDSNGNPTSVTPPERPPHRIEYAPVNPRAAYTPPTTGSGGTATVYSYNLDKQLTQIVRADSTTIGLTYDGAGYLVLVSFPGGELRFDYQAISKQLVSISAPQGSSISYEYDGRLLTKTTWGGTVKGAVTCTFDNNWNVISRTVNGDHPIAYEYDADGLLAKAGDLTIEREPQNRLVVGTKLGKVTTVHEYNGFGGPKRFTATVDKKEVFTSAYEYDSLGRIVKLTETVDGQTDSYIYRYDLASRLARVMKNDIAVARYAYDSNDNRVEYEGPFGTVTGSYNAQDKVLEYGGISFKHTASGEWASKTESSTTTAYEYDPLGNLRRVLLSDGTKIEYVIDGASRRVGKKVNGRPVQGLLYETRLRPTTEQDGENNIVSRFVFATKINVPEYMEKDGRTYRIITDHLGSPRLVINVLTGAIVQRMDYDQFGCVLADSNPGFQPFGFAGGLYDQHTGLVRFGLRDYDPITGRWLAADPIGLAGGLNVYAYVGNNPVTRIDPTGRRWEGTLPPPEGAAVLVSAGALITAAGEQTVMNALAAAAIRAAPGLDFAGEAFFAGSAAETVGMGLFMSAGGLGLAAFGAFSFGEALGEALGDYLYGPAQCAVPPTLTR